MASWRPLSTPDPRHWIQYDRSHTYGENIPVGQLTILINIQLQYHAHENSTTFLLKLNHLYTVRLNCSSLSCSFLII